MLPILSLASGNLARGVLRAICAQCLACAAFPAHGYSPVPADLASPAEVALRNLRYREAQVLFTEELQQARESGEEVWQARVLQSLGNIDRVNGTFEASRDKLSEALALIATRPKRTASSQKETELEADARLEAHATHVYILHDLSNALWALHQFDQANQHITLAISLGTGVPISSIEPDMQADLGRIELARGRLDAARQMFEAALNGYRHRHNVIGVASMQRWMGELVLMQGLSTKASLHFAKAQRLYQRMPRMQDAADMMRQRSSRRYADDKGASGRDISSMSTTQNEVRRQVERDIQTRAMNRAHYATLMQDYDKAKPLFALGLSIARAQQSTDGEARALTWLGHNAELSLEFDDALKYFNEALVS
jgi:tetratricopeptide (TPR) repeat protein